MVGSDGTIYVANLAGGDIIYRSPIEQAGATNHFEICDPGWRCVNDVCKHICPGDCDLSESVAVNELISSVGVSLGTTPFTQCAAADSDRDGLVAINELIAAVNRALQGCSPPTGSIGQQLDRIVIGTGSAIPGASVTIPISVVGSAGMMAGVQVDVLYDDAVFSITPNSDCTIASRLSSTHQFGASSPATPSAPAGKKRLRILVYSRFDSILTFTDGLVANCTFQISATGPPGSYVLDGERQQASDTAGNILTLQAQDGSITVCGGCGCS